MSNVGLELTRLHNYMISVEEHSYSKVRQNYQSLKYEFIYGKILSFIPRSNISGNLSYQAKQNPMSPYLCRNI